ncbi:MAG: hypothetical protein DHS80DRAFT_23036 [Piptocephalis tieghemiana]|nr:MAG: hypothetical protein DHS80DRAFT_23036 [Piptocephalis tieghemiana]
MPDSLGSPSLAPPPSMSASISESSTGTAESDAYEGIDIQVPDIKSLQERVRLDQVIKGLYGSDEEDDMEELPEANDLPGKAHLLAPKSPNQGYSVSNDNEDAFSSDEEMEGMDYTPQHAAPTQGLSKKELSEMHRENARLFRETTITLPVETAKPLSLDTFLQDCLAEPMENEESVPEKDPIKLDEMPQEPLAPIETSAPEPSVPAVEETTVTGMDSPTLSPTQSPELSPILAPTLNPYLDLTTPETRPLGEKRILSEKARGKQRANPPWESCPVPTPSKRPIPRLPYYSALADADGSDVELEVLDSLSPPPTKKDGPRSHEAHPSPIRPLPDPVSVRVSDKALNPETPDRRGNGGKGGRTPSHPVPFIPKSLAEVKTEADHARYVKYLVMQKALEEQRRIDAEEEEEEEEEEGEEEVEEDTSFMEAQNGPGKGSGGSGIQRVKRKKKKRTGVTEEAMGRELGRIDVERRVVKDMMEKERSVSRREVGELDEVPDEEFETDEEEEEEEETNEDEETEGEEDNDKDEEEEERDEREEDETGASEDEGESEDEGAILGTRNNLGQGKRKRRTVVVDEEDEEDGLTLEGGGSEKGREGRKRKDSHDTPSRPPTQKGRLSMTDILGEEDEDEDEEDGITSQLASFLKDTRPGAANPMVMEKKVDKEEERDEGGLAKTVVYITPTQRITGSLEGHGMMDDDEEGMESSQDVPFSLPAPSQDEMISRSSKPGKSSALKQYFETLPGESVDLEKISQWDTNPRGRPLGGMQGDFEEEDEEGEARLIEEEESTSSQESDPLEFNFSQTQTSTPFKTSTGGEESPQLRSFTSDFNYSNAKGEEKAKGDEEKRHSSGDGAFRRLARKYESRQSKSESRGLKGRERKRRSKYVEAAAYEEDEEGNVLYEQEEGEDDDEEGEDDLMEDHGLAPNQLGGDEEMGEEALAALHQQRALDEDQVALRRLFRDLREGRLAGRHAMGGSEGREAEGKGFGMDVFDRTGQLIWQRGRLVRKGMVGAEKKPEGNERVLARLRANPETEAFARLALGEEEEEDSEDESEDDSEEDEMEKDQGIRVGNEHLENQEEEEEEERMMNTARVKDGRRKMGSSAKLKTPMKQRTQLTGGRTDPFRAEQEGINILRQWKEEEEGKGLKDMDLDAGRQKIRPGGVGGPRAGALRGRGRGVQRHQGNQSLFGMGSPVKRPRRDA